MPTIEEADSSTEAWVADKWDPNLLVGEWWQRLADERLAHPMLPEEAGGRGWGRDLAQTVLRVLARNDALGPPTGLGMMLAAPTIAVHGTAEQIARYIPPILNGEHAWCQLFSEPGAGSDLAGLQTRADQDGDEWTVNGQKVWTSGGQVADMGMLIARTDGEAPKHQGITYFVCEMDQPGVEIRPLTEMTGRAMFNEVFLSDARVGDDAMIGGKGNGWRVANTTLTFERSHLGSGTVPVASAQCGSIAGNLDRRAGDFIVHRAGEVGVPPIGPALFERLVELARKLGRSEDPVIRQRLVELYQLVEVNRLNMLRARAGQGRTGGEGNIGKLLVSELYRQFRDVGNLVVGAEGMMAAREVGEPWIQELTLFSPAPAIYGGTDQVQRNIIGERVLGLPKEPGPSKDTPFSQLQKN
ncbi:MAG: acyl-CoA dehydrogenase family protein [Acidimicrobiales bacterium]